MCADDGCIDHLQRGGGQCASGKRFQDHVPDAAVSPPPKLPKDRVPVAEFLRQVAPRCSGSHQPKHRVEHTAMVPWRPSTATIDQEWLEVRPLIVGHQSANQGRSPQRAALNQFPILASMGLSTRPNRGLARGRAMVDRDRDRRSSRRTPSRPVRQKAAFNRAASAASLAQEHRAEISR